MSIQLPKSREEFASKAYWDNFFTKRRASFEWYGEYADLCKAIHQYCKIPYNILMVGCGNSQLSENMYDVGYENIINIDISDLVIKQMILRNEKKRSKMRYLVMDVMNMTFPDLSFDIVFDKGALDALFSDTSSQTIQNIHKMFNEISRVTKVGGRYLCVSLAQPHIINEVLDYFSDYWFIKAHKLEMNSNTIEEGLGAKLPIFILVLTKAKKKLPMKFLEMHVHEACERFHTNTEMLNAIKSLQDFAVTLNKLEKSTLDHPVSVEVYLTSAVNSSLPRYTVTLVDTKKSDFTSKRHGKYAVFIVPQGQESEAMFSTNEGMRELAKMVGFDRLAIVYLHRGQIYANLEEIKSELSQKIMELCQKGIDSSQQVPFLTSGDCLGVRDICCKVNSSFYGNFIVEDFKSNEGTYYRQLIFINQSLEIHCKARLMSSKNKNKKIKKRIIDHRYLCSRHSKEILASILFNQEIVFSEITTFSMLFIGVRSACVIGFLYMLFPQISIQILEKDEQMIQVMERWYDLSPSSIHVNDKVLENSKKVFDVIVADSFSEDIHNLTNVGSLLKDTGVIVSVNLLFKSSTDFSFRCFFCDDSTNTQDSTNICQTNIRYFISRKCETNLSALTNILEMRIHQFKQFIATCRKDFYDKMEWNTLDNLHKLAEMEEISFNNKSENTSEKLSE